MVSHHCPIHRLPWHDWCIWHHASWLLFNNLIIIPLQKLLWTKLKNYMHICNSIAAPTLLRFKSLMQCLVSSFAPFTTTVHNILLAYATVESNNHFPQLTIISCKLSLVCMKKYKQSITVIVPTKSKPLKRSTISSFTVIFFCQVNAATPNCQKIINPHRCG